MTGGRIVQASWGATAVFVVVSLVGLAGDGTPRAVAAAVDIGLFVIGVVVFGAAYAVAVGRSRTDELGIGGLFFLAGDTAPPAPRLQLRLSAGIQVVVALAAAIARPFTTLAFGILVPILGLALMGLWGARHGTFAPRHRR